MAMVMALSKLSLGQLVEFPIENRRIQGRVARESLPGEDDALIVDVEGQLYSCRPMECDHLPKHLADYVKRSTSAIMRSTKFKRQLRALSGTTTRVRIHRTVVKAPGSYGDAKRGFVGPGGSFHGALDLWDIPLKMAEGRTSNLTQHMVRRLSITYSRHKRGQLRQALHRLEESHPSQADAFIRAHLGGRPWVDGEGRILYTPMNASDIARLQGVTPQAVGMALKRAHIQLEKALRFCPLRYVTYGRKSTRAH